MLRNLINNALRSRTGTVGAAPARGRGRRSAAADPGAQIGAQVGRSLFAALRRR